MNDMRKAQNIQRNGSESPHRSELLIPKRESPTDRSFSLKNKNPRLAGEDGMAGHVERAVGIDPAADAGNRRGVYIGLHHVDFAAAQEVDRGDARMKRRKSVPPPDRVEIGERGEDGVAHRRDRRSLRSRQRERRRARGDFGGKAALANVDADAGDDHLAVSLAEDAADLPAADVDVVRPLEEKRRGRVRAEPSAMLKVPDKIAQFT